MLDTVTESITHFIGAFHLSTEEARMRASYDEFRHDKAKQDEMERSEPPPLAKPGYDLGGYDPHLAWRPKSDAAKPGPDAEPIIPPKVEAEAKDVKDLDIDPHQAIRASMAPDAFPMPVYSIPPPSSLNTLTVQLATMHDDDVFGDIDGMGFATPDSFEARLDHLIGVAQGMTAIALPTLEGATPWIGVSASLQVQVASAVDHDGGAASFTVTGAVGGTHVNGETVDAMPTLIDHLPVFLKPAPEVPASEDGVVPPVEEPEAPTAGLEGHEVVAGGNLAINECHVSMNWLDAGVIAVKGDVTRIDAITQANVLSDLDDLGVDCGPQLPSALINAAMINQIAAPAEIAADALGAVPSNWTVTRIEGDLVTFNWVKQYTFLTDHDRAVITTTGSNTYIGLGDNQLSNTTLLSAFGYRFDLILVGGNLYDISVLSQLNVLLDDDRVGGGTASGGDNLLFNSGAIETAGIDTYGALGSGFAGALEDLAGGASTIASYVAQDGLFSGIDMLRVLYIAGDFVTMNLVEQVNVVGDADQVAVALAEASAVDGADVTVLTGSNALANIATIHEAGVDSVVMAGGAIYTDALIHQAGFLDAGATPTGVAIQGLTSEAVAFLADGMIDQPGSTDADAGMAPHMMDSGSLDVMQTMLA